MSPLATKMLTKVYRMWRRQSGSTLGDDGSDDYGFDSGYDDGDDDDDDYSNGGSWWWTSDGMAVRYGVVALLFGLLLLFFVGGYYHARRRLRKGLPPLAYHRWLVRRYMRPAPQHSYPHYQNPPNQGYQMDNYAPPPPAYSNADAPPPVYQPPEGGSKVMADQAYVYTQPLPPTPGQQVGEGSQVQGTARQ